MSLYLLKGGSVYYFRRPISPQLQSALGRTEFVVSLWMKDIAIAKLRRTSAIAETDKLLAEAAQGAPNASGHEPSKLSFIPSNKIKPERRSDFVESTQLLVLWQGDRKACKKDQDTCASIARIVFEFRPVSPKAVTKKDVADFKNYALNEFNKSNAKAHEILNKRRSMLGVAAVSGVLEYSPAADVRVNVQS